MFQTTNQAGVKSVLLTTFAGCFDLATPMIGRNLQPLQLHDISLDRQSPGCTVGGNMRKPRCQGTHKTSECYNGDYFPNVEHVDPFPCG